MKSILRRLPIKDPPIKLEPIMKLTGNFTVSFIRKLTLIFLELFCIPIISSKNKQELNVNARTIFLRMRDIYLFFISS